MESEELQAMYNENADFKDYVDKKIISDKKGDGTFSGIRRAGVPLKI